MDEVDFGIEMDFEFDSDTKTSPETMTALGKSVVEDDRMASDCDSKAATEALLIDAFKDLQDQEKRWPDWGSFYLAHYLEAALRQLHGPLFKKTDLVDFCSRQPFWLSEALEGGLICEQRCTVTDALIFDLRSSLEIDRRGVKDLLEQETYLAIMDSHRESAWDMLFSMLPIQLLEQPDHSSDYYFNQPLEVQLERIRLLVVLLAEIAFDEKVAETAENKNALCAIQQTLERELSNYKLRKGINIEEQQAHEEELYGRRAPSPPRDADNLELSQARGLPDGYDFCGRLRNPGPQVERLVCCVSFFVCEYMTTKDYMLSY